MSVPRFFNWILGFSLLFGTSACGYTLQGTHSHELEKEGVHSIYLAPARNDTYKVGLENVVYNAMLKSLAAYRGVHLVSDPDRADAILSMTVVQAEAQVAATNVAQSLNPLTIGAAIPSKLPQLNNVAVANLYNAHLNVSFKLQRRNDYRVSAKKLLWAGSITRDQLFEASNQLGSLGTTSMLINESEFDRAIQNVSKDMMADAREAMLSRF
jgi:hypothetical protein